MAGTTAIIILPEVVLDTKVSLAEEAGAGGHVAVGDLTARHGAGVEEEAVSVDVSDSWAFLRILRRQSLLKKAC